MRAVTSEELEEISAGLKKVHGNFKPLIQTTVTATAPPRDPPGWGFFPITGTGGGGTGGVGGGGGGGGGVGGGGGSDPGIVDPTEIGSHYTTPDGRDVTITYQPTLDGTSSDQPVSNTMAATLDTVLNDDTSLTSIDISSTTNGVHTSGSDHYAGDAIDINVINDVHVSSSGQGYELAKGMEKTAMNNSNVRFVEGPYGDFARTSPTSPWQHTKDLSSMNSHVHISVFKD